MLLKVNTRVKENIVKCGSNTRCGSITVHIVVYVLRLAINYIGSVGDRVYPPTGPVISPNAILPVGEKYIYGVLCRYVVIILSRRRFGRVIITQDGYITACGKREGEVLGYGIHYPVAV